MIKVSIQQEDITIVNIYTPNIGASKYIKQVLIVGDFNIPLTSMERLSRYKINQETLALNGTLDQIDLIDT